MGVVPSTYAVIHLSSESAVFYLVEYTVQGDMHLLEEARREITFGAEVFQKGFISFGTVRDVCELLLGFKQMMSDYGCHEYRLVATTALREAQNQVYIVDQIKIKTGLDLEVLHISEENYFIYSALFREAMDNKFNYNILPEAIHQTSQSILFADVSSGGMSVALYAENELQYLQNINVSAMRIKENFNRAQREDAFFPEALEEFVAANVESIVGDLRSENIQCVVFAGAEVPLLLKLLRHQLRSGYIVINRLEFLELYKSTHILNNAQLTRKYDLVEDEAEYVLPMLTIYRDILFMTTASEIVITRSGFLQGLALDAVAKRTGNSWNDMLEGHVCQLARSYAEKYRYDEKHALAVEDYSLKIFDAMAALHGLGRRERFMLKIACILHDIGKHTGLRKHYRNSFYLIRSYDLLGFSEDERTIIAFVAFYHASAPPKLDSHDLQEFDASERMTIAKLSAIIRIADALDRGHRQKISNLQVNLNGEELILSAKCSANMVLEEWALEEKAEFFEEVYGIIPTLRKEG